MFIGTLEFCDLVEPAGFDFLMAAEHHFHPYSMCHDNIDFLLHGGAHKDAEAKYRGGDRALVNPTGGCEDVDARPFFQQAGDAWTGAWALTSRNEYVRH